MNNPEQANQEAIQSNQSFATPLFQVTTVSKYLALLLFVLLPFIGGYVGYSIVSSKLQSDSGLAVVTTESEIQTLKTNDIKPIRVVVPYECAANERVSFLHTCFNITDVETGAVLIPDVTSLALEQNRLNTNLGSVVVLTQILYVSADKNIVYFYSGIPASDGCCNLQALRLDTLTFFDVSSLMGSFFTSIVSPAGRFIAWPDAAGSMLRVSDLERGVVLETLPLESNYTLLGRCNEFAGVEQGDISFKGDLSVSYGLFAVSQKNDCLQPALLKRTLSLQ